ncbi:MAG: DUF4133 domain-containing protein [Runella slithyformis]|nr:MAG: DUF4133 domain-containing protein [Runella slithyformis]TAE99981.1 MAG: DUF4133 domain-containing protein [Runella slithyformis]TAF27554.1 MAG: DUF4133 domain-containing protein [Runella slithyformis]TAF46068.1 MAG: DUF4133 domain-containing protein [Runella slithyformis]TAF82250.1 MAG: DUF4133 domain-containing protein [Runella slithyformis]
MKSFPVFRGVDNEIEFKGLRGKYFYYAAVGIVVSIFLTLFLYIIGLNPLLAISVLLLGAGSTLFYTYDANKRHGRWGTVKLAVKNQKPFFVYQNRSFARLVEIQTLSKRK